MLIYVISATGHPLMPTTRGGRVRALLNEKKAVIVSMKPFTVWLLYDTPEITQTLVGGTDPGRTNIGEAVLNEKGETVYRAHVETRNKEIKKNMSDRKAHRMASRRGERKRRQRRARKNGTCFAGGERERILPGYEEPIVCKDIINSEAKFNNRRRPEGWITPTVRQLVETHLNMVDKIRKILPVDHWVLEYNSFSFMQMDNPNAKGKDFQNGRLRGYDSPQDYVFQEQHGKCVLCGRPIEAYHHIIERREDGSDLPENLVGLCRECHANVHLKKNAAQIKKIGERKRYVALSTLNQAIPYIYKGLVERFGEDHVLACRGCDTSALRKEASLDKDHSVDAACIAAIGLGVKPILKEEPFEIKQFRRHNRAIINNQRERTYKVNSKTVAKNRRRRFSQTEYPGFDEYLRTLSKEEKRELRQTLTVEKSKRRYNDIHRPYLPGCIFIYEGKRYVLKGRSSGGKLVTAYGKTQTNQKGKTKDAWFDASKCRFIQMGGLIYV